MSTIVTRAGKGSPLTHTEVDNNFTNLNSDKTENASAAITGGTINGASVGASNASSGAFTSLSSSSTTTLNGTTIPASKTLVVTTDIGTSVQAYDAQLADVAGLSPTDNGVIIGNGTNFVVETGDTLRTSLGLAIGTNVQAYDAKLSDIAGLTPTDNGVVIGDGTNFVVESGATLKTSLGLTIGTDVQAYDADTAKTDVAQTYTAGQRGEITALTDGATITPDFADSNNFSVTLGGNRTLANPSNIVAGQSGSFFITQDGTGSRTLAYGSYYDFAGGTAPTLSTAASSVDRIDYIVRTSTSIHCVFTANYS
jgi:hypothetical protein